MILSSQQNNKRYVNLIKKVLVLLICSSVSILFSADIPVIKSDIDPPFDIDYAMVPFQGRDESLLDIIRLAQAPVSQCPDHLKEVWLNMKRARFFHKTVLWKKREQKFYQLSDPCITVDDIRAIPLGKTVLCNLFRYSPEYGYPEQIGLSEINDIDIKNWQEKKYVFLKDVSFYSSFQSEYVQEGEYFEDFKEPISFVVVGTDDEAFVKGLIC
jgi:hypothetical protein